MKPFACSRQKNLSEFITIRLYTRIEQNNPLSSLRAGDFGLTQRHPSGAGTVPGRLWTSLPVLPTVFMTAPTDTDPLRPPLPSQSPTSPVCSPGCSLPCLPAASDPLDTGDGAVIDILAPVPSEAGILAAKKSPLLGKGSPNAAGC